jgi:hypothetical protein
VLSVRLIGALGLLLSVGFLLGASSAALAAEVHVFSTSFGTAGSGDGQLELAEHSGLAVNDTSHDIYVATPATTASTSAPPPEFPHELPPTAQ